MEKELLPFCDGLFNLVSLTAYFCDIVFNVLSIYTFYHYNCKIYFYACLTLLCFSLLISQIFSLHWYFKDNIFSYNCLNIAIIFQHFALCGVLFRYIRLFIPVKLSRIKNDVRALCILRLIHSFMAAMPMLSVQLYLRFKGETDFTVKKLQLVTIILCLFNLCWSLASFSKHVRKKNLHKLVLTWLSVLFQFGWRLGTIIARSLSLMAYASLYAYWVFLVIGLHWLTMFLWMISPKGLFHKENMPFFKRIFLSSVIAWIYVVCYLSIEDGNKRNKIILFYITMFFENSLLIAVWFFSIETHTFSHYIIILATYGAFVIGISFMVLYYKFFHVQLIRNEAVLHKYEKCSFCNISHKLPYTVSSIKTGCSAVPCDKQIPLPVQASQGVFNCNLHPAFNRKKKKPSSFIPPPQQAIVGNSQGCMLNTCLKQGIGTFNNADISSNCVASSDAEGSISSKINIQQKLAEKKQAQLQQLRAIEEEIRSGKLQKPLATAVLHQPIPSVKWQPCLQSSNVYAPLTHLMLNHQLASCKYGANYQPEYEDHYSTVTSRDLFSKPNNHDKNVYKSHKIPSDVESHLSIPRSYTLPREFRFRRKLRSRLTLEAPKYSNASDEEQEENEPKVIWNNLFSYSVPPWHHETQL